MVGLVTVRWYGTVGLGIVWLGWWSVSGELTARWLVLTGGTVGLVWSGLVWSGAVLTGQWWMESEVDPVQVR